MMDPIFKNRFNLKKDYENMHTNILPSLNDCGYCTIFKCTYCLKFSAKCGACEIRRCKNFTEFNKFKKKILFECDNPQITYYVRNFLVDYFSVSDLTKEFLKINLPEGKDPLYIHHDNISRIWYWNQLVTNEKIHYDLKGKKHCLKVIPDF